MSRHLSTVLDFQGRCLAWLAGGWGLAGWLPARGCHHGIALQGHLRRVRRAKAAGGCERRGLQSSH